MTLDRFRMQSCMPFQQLNIIIDTDIINATANNINNPIIPYHHQWTKYHQNQLTNCHQNITLTKYHQNQLTNCHQNITLTNETSCHQNHYHNH